MERNKRIYSRIQIRRKQVRADWLLMMLKRQKAECEIDEDNDGDGAGCVKKTN